MMVRIPVAAQHAGGARTILKKPRPLVIAPIHKVLPGFFKVFSFFDKKVRKRQTGNAICLEFSDQLIGGFILRTRHKRLVRIREEQIRLADALCVLGFDIIRETWFYVFRKPCLDGIALDVIFKTVRKFFFEFLQMIFYTRRNKDRPRIPFSGFRFERFDLFRS